MAKITPSTREDTIKQLQSFALDTQDFFVDGNKPYIIHVAPNRINIKKSETIPEILYKLCSRCYKMIDSTWDHSTWCEAYEEEKLSSWIKKGKKR